MTTLTFKVSDAEARRMRRQAKQAGLNLSEWLRQHVCASTPQPPIKRVRCSETGAEIFAGSSHLPKLTTESVREMLSDFP